MQRGGHVLALAAVLQPGQQGLGEPLAAAVLLLRERGQAAGRERVHQVGVALDDEITQVLVGQDRVVGDDARRPQSCGELGQAQARRHRRHGLHVPDGGAPAGQRGPQLGAPPRPHRHEGHHVATVRGDQDVRAEAGAQATTALLLHDDGHDLLRDRPARSRGGRRERGSVRRPGEQQAEQLAAPAVALAGAARLLGRVALGAHRGQLVDVREDRLGERHQQVGLDEGGERREAPERDARPDAVGREQRLEAAPLQQLAAAEGEVDAAVVRRQRGRVGAGQVQEALEGDLHAEADALAEAPLERPGVRRDLRRDAVEQLVDDLGEVRPDAAAEPGGKAGPGACDRHSTSSVDDAQPTVRAVTEPDVHALWEQGRQALAAGDPRAAVHALEQVAAAEPGNRSVRYELARAYYAFAALGPAETTARALLEQDPVDADAAHLLGRALARQGRSAEATRYLRLAATLDPTPEHVRWADGGR